jgi:hypothetical protein
MPFVIMKSAVGAYTMTLDGMVGATRISGLRFELAGMLASRAKEIELRVLRSTCIDGAGLGVLRSFFDVFWARGGRLVVSRDDEAPVPIHDPTNLLRLLRGSSPRSRW